MHYLVQKTDKGILTSTLVDGTPLRSCIEANVPKYLRKYMAIAKTVGTIDNPCYSRKIGIVIAAADLSHILGTGYNGPPRKTPHTTTEEYIRQYLFPQLNQQDIDKLADVFEIQRSEFTQLQRDSVEAEFVRRYKDCDTCPRRLLGIPSGERPFLCSCEHGERNAIYNSTGDLKYSVMFCWCGVPCIDCTKAIINSQIAKVICLKAPLYHEQSPWLFRKAGVELWEIEEEVLGL